MDQISKKIKMISQKLEELKNKFHHHEIDGYLVPKNDEYFSEFAQKDKLNSIINEKINAQIDRTRNEESSPKNTTLYFNILLETKDLLKSVFNLIDEYSNSYKKE